MLGPTFSCEFYPEAISKSFPLQSFMREEAGYKGIEKNRADWPFIVMDTFPIRGTPS